MPQRITPNSPSDNANRQERRAKSRGNRRGKAIPSIARANNNLGGARSTQKARRIHAVQFLKWCSEQGHPIMNLQDASKDWVIRYLKFRSQGDEARRLKPLSIGTLRNIQSSLNAMINWNRHADDERQLKSSETGLPKRSRIGKKRPITDEELTEVMARAEAMADRGFVLMLRMERLLGLRGFESLMAFKALQRFHLEMQATGQTPNRFEVLQGTKGGKYRAIEFIKAKRDETLGLLQEAYQYAEANGDRLLQGRAGTLLSARTRYANLCRRVGLVGEISAHSLRYAYSGDKLRELMPIGLTEIEAAEWVALSLGHGASRGRLVISVYGRSIISKPIKVDRKSLVNGQTKPEM
jgi:integrase